MVNLNEFPGTVKAALCCLLLLSASAGFASTYDPDTGILSVPCLEALKDGEGTGVFYTVEMQLSGDMLEVMSISRTGEGFTGCSATFDPVTLQYDDLVTRGSDQYEYKATFLGGRSLALNSVLRRVNLVPADVTVNEFDRGEVVLPEEINTAALTLSLDNERTLPDFIGLLDNRLIIEPQEDDRGVYTLRLQWDDMLELIDITVRAEGSGSEIDFSAQPSALPAYSSLNLYSRESPFNKTIPFDAAIDPDSDALIQSIVASMKLAVVVGQYSTPVYLADNSTPRRDVDLACGGPWELGISKMVDIPIPGWAVPANDVDGEPVPAGCGEDSGQDNFMVVLDLDKRCEYDLWQARKVDGSWEASFGVGVSMDGPGVNAHGLSARGSGFAFLGGVIWPDELAAGAIDHPLAFSYDFTRAGGPVAPATDSDGITDSENAIPEGAIIQLDPGFDLASLDLEPYELAIARALQQYGMILVDTGGAGGPVGFYAIDPDSVTGTMYDGVWPDEDYIVLENLDVNTLPLRVLALGPQDGNYQDDLSLNLGRCSAYR